LKYECSIINAVGIGLNFLLCSKNEAGLYAYEDGMSFVPISWNILPVNGSNSYTFHPVIISMHIRTNIHGKQSVSESTHDYVLAVAEWSFICDNATVF
jgi:hypothetical protein